MMTGGEDGKDDASVESITKLARKEFDRPEFVQEGGQSSRPILIRNFSVKKDEASTSGCCCSDPTDEEGGLEMAPNFASAIMGKWLAAKLGIRGPSPPKLPAIAAGARSGSDGDCVVQDVDALLLPGEGTLLLGPSSSGKTTLMRSVCDKIGSNTSADNLEGTIKVGSVDPSESEENLKRTTAFVDQSDLTLTPILTVEETVRFARTCAEGDSDILDESLEGIFCLTGLDHVKNTVVGNADIRGVSGGQKRRVKMLEMAVGIDVTTMFMDEITNGLDASSALSICKVLRAALEVQSCTAITCLLQPSTEVFRTFHRLILLTPDGRVAYSGKAEGAVPHFESLGLVKPKDMNEPEFLLRCASTPGDVWDRESRGEIPSGVSSSANLAKSFKESDAGLALVEELDRVESEEAERDNAGGGKQDDGEKGSYPARLADFAQPSHRQVGLLMSRGWKLVKRNPATSMRAVSAIIFGVFIGTLFLQTPADTSGTVTRASYVLTLLFIVFLNSCMAPLDDLYGDRNTFYTHRRASFYRTASYYVSQVLCSWPVALVEAFLLCVLSFFAVGMNSHGGWGFFYFWALFSLVTMCGTAVSRILAYSLPTNDMAQSLGPAALLLFVLSACYSPQYTELPSWLRWLAWLSPCAYCYEGVIVNEVLGRNVENATGLGFAQDNLGIPRIPYASAPSGLSTESLVMAFDAYILVVLTIVFEVCGCCLLHHSQKWYGPNTKRFQVASGMSLTAPPWYSSKNVGSSKITNPALAVEEGDDKDTGSAIPPAPSAHLTANDIVYEVDVPIFADEPTIENADEKEASTNQPHTAREYGQAGKGAAREWVIKRQLGADALSSTHSSNLSSMSSTRTKLEPPEAGRLRLLSGVTASFEPGSMTALMGESGAGKSTLLDVLAGYKTGGHTTGQININGKAKTDATWRSLAGYCEQTDLHNPAMTVRESLIFAARMRLRPFSIADQEKVGFASKVLELLELDEFADMLVGNEAAGEGLPKHARKRLTVGVELAANPSILFADEPTSGLDSLSASVVVASLERAAKIQGLTVVCTIHQPSREVFEAFDNLLLLRKGGVCVFNGTIGDLNQYIQTAPNGHEYAMPDEANPADHVLEVFCGSIGDKQDWGQFYEKSEMAEAALANFNSCPCMSCERGEISVDVKPQSFTSELYIVFQRQVLAHWRTPTYMAVRFWWTVTANLIVGLVYFQASESGPSAVSNIIGAIFFYVNIATVPLLSAMVPLITERAVYYREVASGTYRRVVYGLAVQLAEVPFNLGAAIISFVIFYFMVGLKLEAERAIYFLLMALASYWVLPAFGQLFAFLSPNIGAAVGIGSLLMTLFTLTMGFLIPASEIPVWYIWIYWLNPLRYVLQGMVVNEIGGNPEGDAVLDVLTWSYDDRWWYCYVATILFGAVASIGIVASTRISWLKR